VSSNPHSDNHNFRGADPSGEAGLNDVLESRSGGSVSELRQRRSRERSERQEHGKEDDLENSIQKGKMNFSLLNRAVGGRSKESKDQQPTRG